MRSARLGRALEVVAWELPGSVLSLIVDLPDLDRFSVLGSSGFRVANRGEAEGAERIE